MKSLACIASIALLAMIPDVQAVRVRNHLLGSCLGTFTRCSNLPPRVCCYRTAGTTAFTSAKWFGLPDDGLAVLYNKRGNLHRCAIPRERGRNDPCLSSTDVRGTRYGSAWHHLSASASLDDTDVSGFDCVSSVEPDELVLVDGTTFEIGATTPADVVDELDDIVKANPNTTIDDIPSGLLIYEVPNAEADDAEDA